MARKKAYQKLFPSAEERHFLHVHSECCCKIDFKDYRCPVFRKLCSCRLYTKFDSVYDLREYFCLYCQKRYGPTYKEDALRYKSIIKILYKFPER